MSMPKFRKITVYLGVQVAEELCAEATQLKASPSRLMRYAWDLACDRIQSTRQASELEAVGVEP